MTAGRRAKPQVILDPWFRTMDEVFDPADLDRLAGVADIVWARDEPMPTDTLLAQLATADAVVFGSWRHGPDAIADHAPNLRALLEVAGGHEHPTVGYDEAVDRGVHVGSCAPAFGPVVAEHGLALALAMLRGAAEADRAVRAGTEVWLEAGNLGNNTLFDATVGFVGCGGISRHLQHLLEPFGPTLLGYDPPLPADELRQRSIAQVSLEEMFDRSDVVFVLAAPTPETDGMVSRDLLARLGPGQGVVILSRASVVDFPALLELSAKNGFRFASEVYPIEPLPANDASRMAPNGVLSPHLAGGLPGTLRQIGRMVVDDLLAILAGDPPTNLQYLTAENRHGLIQSAKGGWTHAR